MTAMADKISDKAYSPFKTAICNYLREVCKREPSFVEKVKNPKKNIDKCLDYIIGEVKQSGRCGFADDEIFALAVHYYDESDENLSQHKHIASVKVVVNREMPFTDEEKAKAREQAYNDLVSKEKNRLQGGTKKPTTTTSSATSKAKADETPRATQMSLF